MDQISGGIEMVGWKCGVFNQFSFGVDHRHFQVFDRALTIFGEIKFGILEN